MNKPILFANVILPLPLPKLFTYGIPKELTKNIHPGKRVIVQFGTKKIYTAIIKEIHKNKPAAYKTKDIITVLDDHPIINQSQFTFWEWIANYYMCTLGEVYKAALPAGLKLESETRVFYNPQFTGKDKINKKEELILNVLEDRNMINIKEITAITGRKDSLPTIKSLLDKEAVFVEEKLKEGYRPKLESYVKLNPQLNNEKKLNEIFDQMGKAPKQLELLMNYIRLSRLFNQKVPLEVKKKSLISQTGSNLQSFNTLLKKNIFEVHTKQVGRFEIQTETKSKPKSLNNIQKKAFDQINEHFKEKDVVLLHGVTSSGKTEIYIHLIDKQLKKGKQVLFLLPEIALTIQIINRLKQVFGNKVGVYHSKFTDAERVEVWNSVQRKIPQNKNTFQIILGVRSSIFLPFHNLGLIIIDEEHENTYKQFDPAPRYHARDTAIFLARIHNAKTLLGTATPAIDTYFNVQNNKYALVELAERYKNIELPEILIANVREAYRKKQMKSHFTPLLLKSINNALENKEQVILFQNRRGFSPYLECNICGWIPYCDNCNVSLTYHKHINQLVCHYCGFAYQTPKICKACESPALQTMGFGTEKIEDEIAIFFPESEIARMDLDTTRSRKAYERIIFDFEINKINILIGTQMISKGLDFDNVSVVGILNADNMLNFPDFRAFERSFQLMTQVSGRAGRKNKRGKVIIQTSNPDNSIIRDVIANNFLHMYNSQVSERKKFHYPPLYRLIQITIKHKKKEILNDASKQLANELRTIFGKRVMGPEFPSINKIQNWYLKNILLKIEKEKSSGKAKEYLTGTVNKIKSIPAFKSLQIILDVDPM